MVAEDPAVCGSCRCGYFRCGMKNRDFDDMIAEWESGGTSCDVTRRKLSLGARDSTTGWRAKEFSEDTVKAIFIPRASTQLALRVGTYVRTDALLFTCAGFTAGDEVQTADGRYWEVVAVREFYWTQDDFHHRECDLELMPLHF